MKFVYISEHQYNGFTGLAEMKTLAMNAPVNAILKCSKNETFMSLCDNDKFPKIAWYWYSSQIGTEKVQIYTRTLKVGGVRYPVYKIDNQDEKPKLLYGEDYPTEGMILIAITKER